MSAEAEAGRKEREQAAETKGKNRSWRRPAIEWEEPYEPVVFAASCTSQPFNCGSGARD